METNSKIVDQNFWFPIDILEENFERYKKDTKNNTQYEYDLLEIRHLLLTYQNKYI